MFRKLHALLSLCAATLLLLVAVLWVRSHWQADTFTLRTAHSYSGWPRAKWVVVRSRDALVLSAYLKVVPSVELDNPPWREDVPPGYIVPVSDSPDPSVLKRVQPPTAPGGRPMTAGEHRTYESRIAPLYSACPVSQWQARPPAPPANPPDDLNAALRLLGAWAYPENYFVDEDTHPGAYRDVGVRVPFALAAAALAVLPLSWVPLWLRRRSVRRRRLLANQCPRCGYDLRGGPGQCPECGRAVVAGEPDTARRGPVGLWLADLRRTRPRRRTVFASAVASGAVGVALALLLLHDAPRGAPRLREATMLRAELDSQFAAIAKEVERLRHAGEAAGADQLEGELAAFRRRAGGSAEGAAADAHAVPELHMVGLYRATDYRPGAEAGSNQPPEPPQGTATVEVTVADRPVQLALCANDPVKWDLRLAAGARVQRVILGGRGQQVVTGLPAGVPVMNVWGSGGGTNVRFFAYQRDTAAFAIARANLRGLTTLPVTTFQGRYLYGGEPLVVGPPNPAWETQRILSDLRPLYRRATAFERTQARAALGSLRFNALWMTSQGGIGPPTHVSLAEFDVAGPIRSTMQPLTGHITGAALDPKSNAWYAVLGTLRPGLLHPASKRFTPFAMTDHATTAIAVAGIAFDPGRRRLAMVCQNSKIGAELRLYTPDDGKRLARQPLGAFPGYESLTWSEADDCYYALGQCYGPYGGRAQAITRISADGVTEWRIPVTERLTDPVRRGPAFPPQVAAAGPYVALLTAPLPDPEDPHAPEQPRCVLVDPKTMKVLYNGAIAPHDTARSPAPTAG
jgi:hypothetical protein